MADTSQPSSPARRAWRRFTANRPALGALGVLAAAGLFVTLGPWLLRLTPEAISEAQFAAPTWRHWFGTDVHGRDLLARCTAGARVSLLVGLTGATVSLVIGVLWGAVAGYAGGRLDALMMRVVDILYSLPSIILVIVLVGVLQAPLRNWLGGRLGAEGRGLAQMVFLFVGLGAVSWLTMARIVRGQILTLKARPFVEASRALGAGPGRILFRHLLPNVTGVIAVYLTLTIPAVILGESFLSYLGLGIQPPQASLGSLIAEGAAQINAIRVYWWLLAFPAGVLVGLLLALAFLGDGLRDALDARAER